MWPICGFGRSFAPGTHMMCVIQVSNFLSLVYEQRRFPLSTRRQSSPVFFIFKLCWRFRKCFSVCGLCTRLSHPARPPVIHLQPHFTVSSSDRRGAFHLFCQHMCANCRPTGESFRLVLGRARDCWLAFSRPPTSMFANLHFRTHVIR